MEYRNKVAANLRHARLHRNLSQEYVAVKLNIRQNAYSKIENGTVSLDLEKLLILEEVFGVKARDLIDLNKSIRETLIEK